MKFLNRSSKPNTQPILKVCRWRNSRADYYAFTLKEGIPVDQYGLEQGIKEGRMIPVLGDGTLDEGTLDSVLGNGYLLPPALQEIINQIPINPKAHAQHLKDKEFEKMINERKK
jgi:hypothetical protein